MIRIHYRRPPDDEQVFDQRELYRDDDVVVTFVDYTLMSKPSLVEGRTILERGSPVVWFTFPGLWHDIGRFHRADGSYTGLYANILTPVRFVEPGVWDTTDLFLDVWIEPGRAPMILDRDEFDEALARGWIDDETARIALEEAERLRKLAERRAWPPPVVEEWTLERALAAVANG